MADRTSLVGRAYVTSLKEDQEPQVVDWLFPLPLDAEGGCQIGGNIATHAGGTAMLRYGTTRELVLGLELVMPSAPSMTLE